MMQPNTQVAFGLPPQASTLAGAYDTLFLSLTALVVFCLVLIVGAGTYFVYRYRWRGGEHNAVEITHNTALELAWSIGPLFIVMGLFVWGFKNYMDQLVPPKDALEIRVTGKKWKWTFEYPNGAQSADEFAVPLNKPVKLIITSNDVLHSFFVPGFRMKMDAVPNKYNVMWFQATLDGPQQVFCAEYCGTDHSNMLAKILVKQPADYDKWLEAHAPVNDSDPIAHGKSLFEIKGGCNACHAVKSAAEQPQPVIGPRLHQLFGRKEKIQDQGEISVDDNYIRESIENPMAKIVEGFAPAMPPFKGRFTDKELGHLIDYIKSLK